MDKVKATRKILFCVLVCALLPCAAHAAHVPPATAKTAFEHATALDKKQKFADAVTALVQAIDIDPEFMVAHQRLQFVSWELKGAAYDDKKLEPQSKAVEKLIDDKYAAWQKRYPDSVGITFGLGNRLASQESPKARDYLLKVTRLDPGNAEAYSLLSQDAQRRGDQKAALAYLQKAASVEPHNSDYAFYYASELKNVDRARWEAASLDVAKRFPTSERGAQALYWLGMGSESVAKRIALWEQLRATFPPEKFQWSANAMGPLFEAYLGTHPAKAAAFARQMKAGAAKGAKDQAERSVKEWDKRIALADTVVTVNRDLSQGKPDQAMAMLDKLATERMSSNAAMIVRLKAKVMASAGKKKEAYESLLKQQAKAPDGDTHAALQQYGKQIGKTNTQTEADLNALLDAGSKPATPFNLHTYTSNETVSLDKLRGKVVFISFWFPGCGPCRAEFPHLEEAVAPFRNSKDFVYLGINIDRDQDDYVDSFMQQTKYSFTPLKGEKPVIDAYDKMGLAPYNLLIDRSGRIVYSSFMATDADAGQMVQRMIGSLMARKASVAASGEVKP
ncbi:redoxin family protein [Dyella agri]|uniref:Redoxin family protein n=1 Tax=Dyella agri TaxID=1926869 RepID=A0ABW8KI02_9GAMM